MTTELGTQVRIRQDYEGPEVLFRYYTFRYSQPIPAASPVVFT